MSANKLTNGTVKKEGMKNEKDILKFYPEEPMKLSQPYKVLSGDDYNRFFTKKSMKREVAMTRQASTLAYTVGRQMISLAEGMPNEEVFPFSRLTLELKEGDAFTLEGNSMSAALQYVPSKGHPDLIAALSKFQGLLHRPPVPYDVIMANGAQHGIYQCLELLVEPGDALITSQYTYTGTNIALKPYEPEIISATEDQFGIIPSELDKLLSSRRAQGLKMPKLLYTIPTGNNPTGSVLSEERKRQIYELACQYDFLIVEDDPYMFLNYSGVAVPSFLSLDVCARVLRLDSLSKVLGAGLRAGWVTAPAPLVARLELHSQVELVHSCTLSQAITTHMISHLDYLRAHLQAARSFYHARRDALQRALERAGMSEVAEWTLPDAGLFFWLRVKDVDDVFDMVFKRAFQRGVMLLPGQAFLYKTGPSECLRLTFGKVPVEQMDEAARTLVEVIRTEQKLTLERARNGAK